MRNKRNFSFNKDKSSYLLYTLIVVIVLIIIAIIIFNQGDLVSDSGNVVGEAYKSYRRGPIDSGGSPSIVKKISYQRPVGDGCTNNNQCFSNNCVQGVCKNLPGGVCSQSNHCTTGICKQGLCKNPVGRQCNENYQCESETCVQQICLNPVGVACTMNTDCVSGLCVQQICRTEAGGTCANTYECLPGASCQGQICRYPRGSACTSDTQCEINNVCHQGTCRSPIRGACTSNTQCVTNVCQTGTCRVAVRGACVQNSECSTNLCFQGVCVNPPGGACTHDEDCITVCGRGSRICAYGNSDYGYNSWANRCTINAHCESGSCDSSSGFCRAILGYSCFSNSDCVDAGVICSSSLNPDCYNAYTRSPCVDSPRCLLPDGSFCSSASHCVSRYCPTSTGRCTPTPPDNWDFGK